MGALSKWDDMPPEILAENGLKYISELEVSEEREEWRRERAQLRTGFDAVLREAEQLRARVDELEAVASNYRRAVPRP